MLGQYWLLRNRVCLFRCLYNDVHLCNIVCRLTDEQQFVVVVNSLSLLTTASNLELQCAVNMVLADLGRKITAALRSLSSATVINEEVSYFSCSCP
jgi:hypothetical protein